MDIDFFRENNRYMDYLRHVSKLEGYGEVRFPHCPCNSRKQVFFLYFLIVAFKLMADVWIITNIIKNYLFSLFQADRTALIYDSMILY